MSCRRSARIATIPSETTAVSTATATAVTAATAAITATAATKAPGKAPAKPRAKPKPLDAALGRRVDFESLVPGKTYYARLPPQSTWFKNDWIFMGKFVDTYLPGTMTLKTPSRGPYVVMNSVEIKRGLGALHTVYKVDAKRDELFDLYRHRGYMNRKHPERSVFLPTTKWAFYELKPYTPTELSAMSPALSGLPEPVLTLIAEFAPMTRFVS